jgi:hypothetical protein
MDQSAGHAPEEIKRNPAGLGQITDSCYTAHDMTPETVCFSSFGCFEVVSVTSEVVRNETRAMAASTPLDVAALLL